MNNIITEKIRIGLSECNFGSQVRWNHVGWDRVARLDREKNDYIWVPVCPEVLSGLGVPRIPIKLVAGTGDDLWQGNARMKNRLGRDVSDELKTGCLSALDILKRSAIDAFAFMEGSPSCGVYRTTLKDNRSGRPPGAFGSLLLKEDWFLFSALDLESPWKFWDIARRLHAFVWLKRLKINDKQSLYEAWHMLKFICQESDDKKARALGVTLANAPKKLTQDFVNAWKKEALMLLRTPSSLPRIEANMTKHYAHYRKTFGLSVREVSVPQAEAGRHRFVEELKKLERKAFDQGYVFAGHPVIYRPKER